MLKIIAMEDPERQKLQKQCGLIESEYIVYPNQINLLKEIFQSIAHEYFHDNLQSITRKALDLILDLLDYKCNLSNFRQLMEIIKKKQQNISFYQEYYLMLNRQFQQNSNQLVSESQKQIYLSQDAIIEESIDFTSSQRHCFSELLPFTTQYIEKDIVSQRTMQSQIIQCKEQMFSAKERLSLFLDRSKSTFFLQNRKKDDKKQRTLNQSSKQLSSFQKKGQNVLIINKIDDLIHEQLNKDLLKQQIKGKATKKVNQIQQFKYNKLIKSSLMNIKLHNRRNIRKSNIT